MKRCPDCGFRADDHVCPLCGVKMHTYTSPVRTHVHTAAGERCVLPNRQPSKPVQQKKNEKKAGIPTWITALGIIALFYLLRACGI